MLTQPKIMQNHSYSQNITNKKIAILGHPPPAIGGIAIHIARVAHQFKQQHNCIRYFDTTQPCRNRVISYFYNLITFLYLYRPTHLYYHTLFLRSNLLEFATITILKKIIGYQLIVVEHNCRYLDNKWSLYKRTLNFFMRLVDKQVLIGTVVAHAYDKHKLYLGSCISVESPFLPPDYTQEKNIVDRYPNSLKQFLKTHTPIITMNGSHIILFNGVDVYGFDMCINLLESLVKTYQSVGFIAAIPRIGNHQYYNQLQNIINKTKLSSHWFFLIQQQEIWPLLKQSDLMVRPNYVDTYGISVEEALCVGTPAIASNVCKRPEGTILFEARNQHDFERKVKETLSSILPTV